MFTSHRIAACWTGTFQPRLDCCVIERYSVGVNCRQPNETDNRRAPRTLESDWVNNLLRTLGFLYRPHAVRRVFVGAEKDEAIREENRGTNPAEHAHRRQRLVSHDQSDFFQTPNEISRRDPHRTRLCRRHAYRESLPRLHACCGAARAALAHESGRQGGRVRKGSQIGTSGYPGKMKGAKKRAGVFS